jgi:hypothetical protein
MTNFEELAITIKPNKLIIPPLCCGQKMSFLCIEGHFKTNFFGEIKKNIATGEVYKCKKCKKERTIKY